MLGGPSLLHSDSKYLCKIGPFEPSGASIRSKLECRRLVEGGPPKRPFQENASFKTDPTSSPPAPKPLGISEPLVAHINPHI